MFTSSHLFLFVCVKMALINFKIHIKTVIRMNISQFFTET